MVKTTNTVFRERVNQVEDTSNILLEPKDKTVGQSDNVEVPYTDYQKVNGKPYTVDHFQLGNTWDDPDGGFEPEVMIIENYLKEKIRNGELANTKSAVKNELKQLERMNNLKNEERVVIKLGTLASFIKFLNETKQLNYNYRKYGYK